MDLLKIDENLNTTALTGRLEGDKFHLNERQYLCLDSEFPPQLMHDNRGNSVMPRSVDINFKDRNCVVISALSDDAPQQSLAVYVTVKVDKAAKGKWAGVVANNKRIYLDRSEPHKDYNLMSGLIHLGVDEIGYFHYKGEDRSRLAHINTAGELAL